MRNSFNHEFGNANKLLCIYCYNVLRAINLKKNTKATHFHTSNRYTCTDRSPYKTIFFVNFIIKKNFCLKKKYKGDFFITQKKV
jgi:hypothetical protein